ncbi:MAG: ATP-binding cassette domain-containing protein [Treponema sp.]|jgi:ABC-2 type transport system ATP-binding protein|nr:ATP-binding cassette domain-containing protein [Treponema sp.]
METKKTILEIQNLVMKFGMFTAVDHLSFSIRQGEVFGFLGANGAGKTTTIKIICGLLKPTAGDVLVNTISVRKHPDKVKRRIGYMSQKFSLYSELTPDSNLDFFGGIYGVPKEQINREKQRLAAELGVPDLSHIRTSSLPMGFKQRLALSCTLLHVPDIIILDEPTSGVDPVGRREFWSEIIRLSRNGKTILVTTHFMDEAEYCDRIVIMRSGGVLALDTPAAVKQRYRAKNLNEAFISAVESGGGKK